MGKEIFIALTRNSKTKPHTNIVLFQNNVATHSHVTDTHTLKTHTKAFRKDF